MLKNKVVFKRRKHKLPQIDYKFIIFYSLFLSGLIIGLLMMKNENHELINALNSFITDFIKKEAEQAFFVAFIDSAIISFFIPVITFILGLCAISVPIIITIPAFTGVLAGMVVGLLYSQYSLQGLGFSALIVMPAAAIITATLLKCCNESIMMSLEIIVSISGGSYHGAKKNELKEYCLKYLILSIPLIVGAIINTACFKLFVGLFSFI